MKSHRKALLAVALLASSITAQASQSVIKVWADVDPTLALLRADGTALPDAVELVHNPASGLVPWTEQVRIYSNDVTADIEVRLGHAPTLLSVNAGPAPVPLTVSLNGRPLTLAAQEFVAGDLFDGALPGASIAMPLRISQSIQAPITTAGAYEGLVSIVMAQKTAAP